MNRRTVLIVLFLISLLVIAGIIAINFINNQDQPQEVQPTPGEGTPISDVPTEEEEIPPTPTPALVEVVVSLQTVPRGHRMTEEILEYDLRKESEVPANVITDMEDAIGLFARMDIFQGETLTVDALVDDPTVVGIEEFGPSSLIPQGFIAMGIPIQDELAGIAYAIDEGDYIDIMISFDIYQIDEEFQTYLENDAIFFVDTSIVPSGIADDSGNSEEQEATEEGLPNYYLIENFGRISELANGDQVRVSPSEAQRPVHIGLVLQNAKVIQVGPYTLPPNILDLVPTPTVDPEEGVETPTPGPAVAPTETPSPPNTLLVALAPQQQLLLKHAIEVGAQIDFALRSPNDNQLFPVENIDLGFLLELFGIEVPPNFDFTLESPDDSGSGSGDGNGDSDATPTPQATTPPSSSDS